MKQLLYLVLLCMSLTSCSATLATAQYEPVQTEVIVTSQIGDGFEYEYYDTYHSRPVVYINTVPYWLYWLDGRWTYAIVPTAYYHHIVHYSRPYIHYRPGYIVQRGFRPYRFTHHNYTHRNYTPNRPRINNRPTNRPDVIPNKPNIDKRPTQSVRPNVNQRPTQAVRPNINQRPIQNRNNNVRRPESGFNRGHVQQGGQRRR